MDYWGEDLLPQPRGLTSVPLIGRQVDFTRRQRASIGFNAESFVNWEAHPQGGTIILKKNGKHERVDETVEQVDEYCAPAGVFRKPRP